MNQHIEQVIFDLQESISVNSYILERYNWVVSDPRRMYSVVTNLDGETNVVPARPFPTLFTAETAQDIVDSLKAYNGRNERIVFQRFTKTEWEQLYLNDLTSSL